MRHPASNQVPLGSWCGFHEMSKLEIRQVVMVAIRLSQLGHGIDPWAGGGASHAEDWTRGYSCCRAADGGLQVLALVLCVVRIEGGWSGDQSE
jgi:hypothetical protein